MVVTLKFSKNSVNIQIASVYFAVIVSRTGSMNQKAIFPGMET